MPGNDRIGLKLVIDEDVSGVSKLDEMTAEFLEGHVVPAVFARIFHVAHLSALEPEGGNLAFEKFFHRCRDVMVMYRVI